MKSLSWNWLYLGGLVLIGLCYISTRDFIIATPLDQHLRISNLTVNYMIVSAASGGTAGRYIWKKCERSFWGLRLIYTLICSLVAAGFFLTLVDAGGYEIR